MNAAWYVVKRLLVVAGLVVVVIPLVTTARSLISPSPATQPSALMAPRSIVWNNRVFSSRSALASWLAANGASYHAWARHHPADAAILDHGHANAFTPPKQKAASASHSLSSPSSKAAPASHSSSASHSSKVTSGSRSSLSWVRFGFFAIAMLLMLVALIPADFVPLRIGGWLNATRRTYVFALGLALCVGVLIAGV